MIRIAICDDEDIFITQLYHIIKDYQNLTKKNFSIETFRTGEDLLNFIQSEMNFDLIFLDIELGSTTGMTIGGCIRNKLEDHISKIVFISGKNGYESELFQLQPLHFLRKPLINQQVIGCIELTEKILGKSMQTFEYKKKNDVLRIPINTVLYFEKQGKTIKIVYQNGYDYFRSTLDEIEENLPNFFIRTHQSFLVNFNFATSLTSDTIVMSNSEKIPISRRNLKAVRNKLLESEEEKNRVTL